MISQKGHKNMSNSQNAIKKIVYSNAILREINKKRLDMNTIIMQKKVAHFEKTPPKKGEFISKYKEKYANIINQTDREIQKLNGVSLDTRMRNDIIFCAIGYGFSPLEYLSYNLEGKNYSERKAFLSDRDTMRIVHLCNDPLDIRIFNDKAQTFSTFSSFYGRNAVCIQNEDDKECFLSFISGKEEIVKKNVNEAMGRSIQLIHVPHESENALNLFYELINCNQKLLIEERIVQDEKMNKLNPSSVNTIRIITFNTKDGIIAPYCFLKIGRNGSFVDNGGAGGIIVGVDIQTGITNTDGRDEYGTLFKHHPDTNVPLKGIQLPEFKQAIELAKHISAITPKVKFIGWDFAYTSNGWIVVEGNGKSQLIGPQLTMQHGLRLEIESILGKMI